MTVSAIATQAIVQADKVPFHSEEEKNLKVAKAPFMRAVYYYNLVETTGWRDVSIFTK